MTLDPKALEAAAEAIRENRRSWCGAAYRSRMPSDKADARAAILAYLRAAREGETG